MSRALLKHRKIERAAIFVSEILTTYSAQRSNEHDIFFFFYRIFFSKIFITLPLSTLCPTSQDQDFHRLISMIYRIEWE